LRQLGASLGDALPQAGNELIGLFPLACRRSLVFLVGQVDNHLHVPTPLEPCPNPVPGQDLPAASDAQLVLGCDVVLVRGDDPIGEAHLGVTRMKELGLDGYVIDAEGEYKDSGKKVAAHRYMEELRAGLPRTTIAFSSYRFPLQHPRIPFETFMENIDKYDRIWITWETKKSYHLNTAIIGYVDGHFEKIHGRGVDNSKVEVYFLDKSNKNITKEQ